MTRRQHAVGIAITVAVLAASTVNAYGDPSVPVKDTHFLHVLSPSHLTTDGGTDLKLPKGYFVDEPSFSALDLEMRRLQTVETRLKAENQSLKGAVSGWQPGWYVLAGTLATGLVAGWYIHSKL